MWSCSSGDSDYSVMLSMLLNKWYRIIPTQIYTRNRQISWISTLLEMYQDIYWYVPIPIPHLWCLGVGWRESSNLFTGGDIFRGNVIISLEQLASERVCVSTVSIMTRRRLRNVTGRNYKKVKQTEFNVFFIYIIKHGRETLSETHWKVMNPLNSHIRAKWMYCKIRK